MDVSSKAEKLSLARKKLKEFEARRERENGLSPEPSVSSLVFSEQAGSAPNSFSMEANGRSSAVSDHSANSYVHVGSEAVRGSRAPISTPSDAPRLPSGDFIVPINGSSSGSQSSQQHDVEKLCAVIAQKDAACEQLTTQLQELHGYYSQLHSAYTELSEKMQNGGDADSTREVYTSQIAQLQLALSVVVSEKTDIQAELRRTKDQLLEHQTQLSTNRNSHAEHTARNERSEIEINNLRSELEEKNRMLEKRSKELEFERTESSNLQVQLLSLQQDRNEAQARLKNVYREKVALDSELKNIRKDLQMKELYIKQLSSHSSELPSTGEELGKLTEEVETLRAEILRLKAENAEALKTSEDVKAYYCEYGKQINENYSKLNMQFEEVSSARFHLENRNRELEDELRMLSAELAQVREKTTGQVVAMGTENADVPTVEEQKQCSEEDIMRVHSTWQRKLEECEKELQDQLHNKDRLLFEREQTTAELQVRLRLLEESSTQMKENSGDLLALAEQLQSEKATVSRAVAQNKELKEQLIETEDRLIALTGEKCELELARQSAEHQIGQLQLRIEQLSAAFDRRPSLPHASNVVHVELPQSNDNSASLVPHGTHVLVPPTQPDQIVTVSEIEETQTTVTEQPESVLAGDSMMRQTVLERQGEDEVRKTDADSDSDDSISTGDASDGEMERENQDRDREQSQDLSFELEQTRRQLEDVRAELRRSNTQNEAMNQIMRQNAEDENQNSILVELDQAVSRIHDLTQENRTLREELSVARNGIDVLEKELLELQNKSSTASASATVPTAAQIVGTTEVNVIELEAATMRINYLKQENEELGEEVKRLRIRLDETTAELESRLKADDADSEKNSDEVSIPVHPPLSLTPVIDVVQTEPENSTSSAESEEDPIPSEGESNQGVSRKTVVGTDEWARSELERRFSETMDRVAQLQEQIDRLEHINIQLQLENDTIADHVVLYQHQRRLIRERLRQKDEQMRALEQERERVVKRCQELQEALMSVLGETGALKKYDVVEKGLKSSRRTARRTASRSYSHSTVDELSGDEECLVDGAEQAIPSRSSPDSDSPLEDVQHSTDKTELQEVTQGCISDENAKEAAVQKILQIINEIQTPSVPLPDYRVHCSQCIGEIKHL